MENKKSLWVMIAGPYGSGAKTEAEKAENVRRLSEAAWAVFQKGHTPIVGMNNILPIAAVAGENGLAAVMTPLSIALAERCDCCFRISGESKGADQEAERFKVWGRPVYHSIDEVP